MTATTDRPATRKRATAPKDTTPAEEPKVEETPEHDPGRITPRQMRELHALLRDHGITGDRAVHEYLTTAGHPVESRSDLTSVAAAQLIAELETAPVRRTSAAAALSALRAPFPENAIGKLPRSTCRACSKSERKRCDDHDWISNCQVCHGRHSSATMHIDYVGHADVTDRLLQVDPEWTWRPFTVEEIQGIPPTLRDGLWIMLTVCGITRPGFGDTENGKGPKEAIGDALRNASMRFGVALDLWAKGDREWAHTIVDDSDPTARGMDDHPPRERTPEQAPAGPAPYYGPSTPELLLQIDSHAQRAGVSFEEITRKWREEHPVKAVDGSTRPMSVPEMDDVPAQAIALLEARIAEYLRSNPPSTD